MENSASLELLENKNAEVNSAESNKDVVENVDKLVETPKVQGLNRNSSASLLPLSPSAVNYNYINYEAHSFDLISRAWNKSSVFEKQIGILTEESECLKKSMVYFDEDLEVKRAFFHEEIDKQFDMASLRLAGTGSSLLQDLSNKLDSITQSNNNVQKCEVEIGKLLDTIKARNSAPMKPSEVVGLYKKLAQVSYEVPDQVEPEPITINYQSWSAPAIDVITKELNVRKIEVLEKKASINKEDVQTPPPESNDKKKIVPTTSKKDLDLKLPDKINQHPESKISDKHAQKDPKHVEKSSSKKSVVNSLAEIKGDEEVKKPYNVERPEKSAESRIRPEKKLNQEKEEKKTIVESDRKDKSETEKKVKDDKSQTLLKNFTVPSWGSIGKYTGNVNEMQKPHGRGVFVNTAGDKFQGEWKDGNVHGKGIMTKLDGEIYDGDWVDNRHDGNGVMTYASGDVYDGEWKEGVWHGNGIFRETDGSTFDGEFRYGDRHGRGKKSYTDGYMYDGEWKRDKRQGFGIESWPDGDIYEGEWINNKKHGRGVEKYPDGSKYEGDYKEGKRSGRGVWTTAEGDKYDGDWRDGNMHGCGVRTYPNGRVENGIFQNGLFKGRATSK